MINLSDVVLPLAISGPTVLACGAWLKNTICLTQRNSAYLSAIGDLTTAEARYRLEKTALHMCKSNFLQPEIVTHDLHPDFYSTQFAEFFAEQHQIPTLAVQHHHAHIAAVCAEHQLIEPVLGLALDGVGLGTDNTPWGGELLLVDGARFHRLGHLATLALPGGDRAAQEPWRMAASALAKLNRKDEILRRFASQPAVETIVAMLTNDLNCPQTSSMGRLFDAAAGLLSITLFQSHEAQAAIQLQQLAQNHGSVPALTKGYLITADNNLDFSPLLETLLEYQDAKNEIPYAAALFHATLIAGLAVWVKEAATQYNISKLVIGGGCFHNAILTNGLKQCLTQSSVQLICAHQMQPDDSAIALGQAWIALQSNHL